VVTHGRGLQTDLRQQVTDSGHLAGQDGAHEGNRDVDGDVFQRQWILLGLNGGYRADMARFLPV